MLILCLIVIIPVGVSGAEMIDRKNTEDNFRSKHPVALELNSKDDEEFMLTKFFDIKLKGGYDSLHPDLRGVIKSQVQPVVKGIFHDQQSVNDDITKYYENADGLLEKCGLGSLIEKLENIADSRSIPNCDFTLNCKYLVGTDKTSPFCDQPAKVDKTFPKSCKEIQQNGQNVSGVYEIQPKMSKKPIMVLCDMETMGGGWTHIHKRFDGSQDFFLGWREYKHGFGKLNGEFWMGLENIYLLTGFAGTELLVEIVDREDVKKTAHYGAFAIGSEIEGYSLKTITDFSGDAGDSMKYHLGANFTTKDLDQDTHASKNCADLASGAWWYKDCFASNLNGKFINIDLSTQYTYHGMHWTTFRSVEYSHSKARMLIRPA